MEIRVHASQTVGKNASWIHPIIKHIRTHTCKYIGPQLGFAACMLHASNHMELHTWWMLMFPPQEEPPLVVCTIIKGNWHQSWQWPNQLEMTAIRFAPANTIATLLGILTAGLARTDVLLGSFFIQIVACPGTQSTTHHPGWEEEKFCPGFVSTVPN